MKSLMQELLWHRLWWFSWASPGIRALQSGLCAARNYASCKIDSTIPANSLAYIHLHSAVKNAFLNVPITFNLYMHLIRRRILMPPHQRRGWCWTTSAGRLICGTQHATGCQLQPVHRGTPTWFHHIMELPTSRDSPNFPRLIFSL